MRKGLQEGKDKEGRKYIDREREKEKPTGHDINEDKETQRQRYVKS